MPSQSLCLIAARCMRLKFTTIEIIPPDHPSERFKPVGFCLSCYKKLLCRPRRDLIHIGEEEKLK